MEVEMEVLRQVVEDVLGEIPKEVACSLKRSDSIVETILAESARAAYDLIAIGASEEWFLRNLLFGSVPDRVADGAPCSVLMVRRYEPAPVSWVRRMIKRPNSGD
jgi:nucleotide-binding universal stress UspA family protein